MTQLMSQLTRGSIVDRGVGGWPVQGIGSGRITMVIEDTEALLLEGARIRAMDRPIHRSREHFGQRRFAFAGGIGKSGRAGVWTAWGILS